MWHNVQYHQSQMTMAMFTICQDDFTEEGFVHQWRRQTVGWLSSGPGNCFFLLVFFLSFSSIWIWLEKYKVSRIMHSLMTCLHEWCRHPVHWEGKKPHDWRHSLSHGFAHRCLLQLWHWQVIVSIKIPSLPSSLSGILTSTFSTQRGESTSMWMSMSMLMNRCAIIKFVIFHLKMKDNHQWRFTVGKLWWFSKKVELGELFWRTSPLARNLTCGWAFPSGSWSFSLTHLTLSLATQPTQRKSSHAYIFPSSPVSKLPWWSYCNDFKITYTESYYM